MSRIPGLSMSLEARRSGTGEEITRPGTAFERFVSPAPVSIDKPDAEFKRFLVDIDAVPSAPHKDLTIPGSHGKKVRLTDDEYSLLTDAASKATDRLQRVYDSSSFRRMDPEEQRSYIQRLYQSYEGQARKRLLQQRSVRDRARQVLRPTA
jgi:hypothetical protein